MVNLITIICKYVMILLMVFFTISAISGLKKKDYNDIKWCFYNQIVFAFLFHGVGSLLILLNEQSTESVIFYLAQVVFFFVYLIIYQLLYKKCNLLLLSSTILFCMVSMLILSRLSLARAEKQFILLGGASIVTLPMPVFARKMKAAKPVAGTCGVLGLLMLIAVPFIGITEFGAKLSLGVKNFSFQPSEFVKVSFVLLIAVLLRKRKDFKRVFFTTCIAAVHVAVLVYSTDLGAALIFFLTYLAILYLATKNGWYAILGLAAGCAASVAAYYLFAHVRVRVTAWSDPWSIIDGGGYQIAQSLFAIGSGKWFGTGLYKGMADRIPVVSKDYIFSAISEEMGGIVAVCLIVLALICFLRFIQIAMEFNVIYYRLIGTGLAVMYGVQICLGVGGVIKFIPSTGVTFPLISYGGSSVASTLIAFGMMQGMYIMLRNEEERNEK